MISLIDIVMFKN